MEAFTAPICYVSWLEEALSSFLSSTEEKQAYIQSQLEKLETKTNSSDTSYGTGYHEGDWANVDHDNPENYHEQNPKFVGLFSNKLTKCAKLIYTGQYTKAQLELESVETCLDLLKGDHTRLKPALNFLLKNLKLKVSTTLERNLDQDKLENLEESWPYDITSQAVILFMKANLQKDIFGDKWETEYSQILARVVRLDPKYPVWYHYAYHSIRKSRRVYSKRQNKLEAPSKQEIDFSAKAHKLAPNLLMTNFDYATMLKDCLWMTVYRKVFPNAKVDPFPLPDFDEAYKKCWNAFEMVGALAKEIGFHHWNLKVTIQKADLLLNLYGTETLRQDGLKLLNDAMKDFPDNAFLLQKFAKLYRYGVPNELGENGIWRDFDKCHFFITEALELHQQNYFECLKMYMDLIPRMSGPVPALEAIGLLTEGLEGPEQLLKEGYQQVQARIWRGLILWLYYSGGTLGDREKACRDWLLVWENYPEFHNLLMDSIKKPLFYIFGQSGSKKPSYVNHNELIQALEKIKKEDAEGTGNISGFIQQVKQTCHKPSYSKRPVGGQPAQSGKTRGPGPGTKDNLTPNFQKLGINSQQPKQQSRYKSAGVSTSNQVQNRTGASNQNAN